MVYSTRRFVLCLTLCYFVLVLVSPFSIAITSLGEEIANLSAFRTFVRFDAYLVLSVSSSSWCLGRAAVCDCGILKKSPLRINHKATKSKANIGTTALERSVE